MDATPETGIALLFFFFAGANFSVSRFRFFAACEVDAAACGCRFSLDFKAASSCSHVSEIVFAHFAKSLALEEHMLCNLDLSIRS